MFKTEQLVNYVLATVLRLTGMMYKIRSAVTGKARHPQQEVKMLPPDKIKRGDKTKKRHRTHKTLVDAALKLYSRRKLDQVSISEIADEAGVTHGTIYNYFRTRDELLQAACMRLVTDITEQITRAQAIVTDPAERVAVAVRVVLRTAARNPDWGWLFLRFSGIAPDFDEIVGPHVRKDLREGLATGRFHYDSESAAFAFIVGCIVMGCRPIVDGWANPHHDVAMARLVLTGLGVPDADVTSLVSLPLPAFS